MSSRYTLNSRAAPFSTNAAKVCCSMALRIHRPPLFRDARPHPAGIAQPWSPPTSLALQPHQRRLHCGGDLTIAITRRPDDDRVCGLGRCHPDCACLKARAIVFWSGGRWAMQLGHNAWRGLTPTLPSGNYSISLRVRANARKRSAIIPRKVGGCSRQAPGISPL